MILQYNDDEQIRRIWEIEAVKELMNRRVYYVAGDLREKELDELWVSDPAYTKTASFGSNWGYYVGMDAIRGYYLDAHKAELAKQKAENGVDAENIGNLYARPMSTGVVELALDGKTAKGLWYSLGQETKRLADGTADARWILGKVAADFVREADGWKLWHLVISVDVDCEAGHDWSEYPVYVDWSENGGNPVRKEFGKPTIEKTTHEVAFNWWDDYPFLPPKDYPTFTDDISYGPEGHKSPYIEGFKPGEGRNWQ